MELVQDEHPAIQVEQVFDEFKKNPTVEHVVHAVAEHAVHPVEQAVQVFVDVIKYPAEHVAHVKVVPKLHDEHPGI